MRILNESNSKKEEILKELKQFKWYTYSILEDSIHNKRVLLMNQKFNNVEKTELGLEFNYKINNEYINSLCLWEPVIEYKIEQISSLESKYIITLKNYKKNIVIYCYR